MLFVTVCSPWQTYNKQTQFSTENNYCQIEKSNPAKIRVSSGATMYWRVFVPPVAFVVFTNGQNRCIITIDVCHNRYRNGFVVTTVLVGHMKHQNNIRKFYNFIFLRDDRAKFEPTPLSNIFLRNHSEFEKSPIINKEKGRDIINVA